MKAQKGRRGIALHGGGWPTPLHGHFTSAKVTRYPMCRRLDEPQDQSGEMRKISPPPVFGLRTVHSIRSRETNDGLPTTINPSTILKVQKRRS